MTVVRLGNTSAVEVRRESDDDPGTRTALDHEGTVVTEMRFADDMPLAEALIAITSPVRGTWDNHSDDPPEWVSSDNEDFARLLAANYSVGGHTCQVHKYVEDDTPVGLGQAKGGPDPADAKPARATRKRSAAAHHDPEE